MEGRGEHTPLRDSRESATDLREGETGQRKCLGSRTKLKRGRFLEQSKRVCRERDGFVSPLN